MNSSVSWMDAAERQSHMEAAQAKVREFEGDSPVVNERYNKKEYRTRRTQLLGFIDPKAKVLPTATADAELVFESQPDVLSVQAVRARELSCFLAPLLPLPTQQNCETLTDYDEYPSQEWQPSDPPTFPREYQNSPPRSSRLSDVQDQATPDDLLQFPRLLHGQQTANLFPAPPYGTINPRLLSNVDMPFGLLNAPSPDTLMQVISDLQYPPGTRRRPLPKYQADKGVASLAGRGISVPVKTPPKSNGRKRRLSEIEEEGSEYLEGANADQAIDLEAAVRSETSREPERPRKKSKKSQASGSSRARKNPTGARSRKRGASEKPAISRAASQAPSAVRGGKAPKAAASGSRAVSERPATNANVKWLSAVSGNRLPKTMKEAQEAAVERKQLLEEAHQIQNRTARNLDFPPEFFNTYNFTEEERANIGNDNGPIRCICGEGEVAGKLDWIQCDSDECGVWQHVECMGDAVPEDEKKREAAKYLCQVCDPWKHRRTIQKLRRLNPDPVLAATKAEPIDDDE